jgi:hypothetical protein
MYPGMARWLSTTVFADLSTETTLPVTSKRRAAGLGLEHPDMRVEINRLVMATRFRIEKSDNPSYARAAGKGSLKPWPFVFNNFLGSFREF